ncbi:MAG: S8 family serine peptidase [candidate division Zixibacteria bacterium]|nr:S8 family serine peptidase [candidate division Zixibacteria bacterium]
MTKRWMPGCYRLFFVTAILLSVSICHATTQLSILEPQPLVISKTDIGVGQATFESLRLVNAESARVWVFFTDKGVFTKQEFDNQATSITVPERSLKRRAKVNKDIVVFADLPVVQEYIDQVILTGGELRHISRWLNAASFDIPTTKLADVASLPHVAELRSVAGYKRKPVEIGQIRFDDIDQKSLSPDALNYGGAAAQLEQISIPFGHNQGLDGSGVTLAILDTGYRKSHEAFANHYAEGRVLAERDFIFDDDETANEPEDWGNQWNHGTYIWSVSGGFLDGSIYGPAYRANFILCKTEDIRSETQVEEDNWVAAMEWADSLGADVLTSSLGYSDWYTYEDYDGLTAVTSAAASTAAGLGIVVCNSAGNSGPGAGTITPPADAFDILCVGNVNSSGTISTSSSHGPTYDGRIKPEVCALGTNTFCASPSSDAGYQVASGTSLSTPLVAGAACLLIQARPEFPPTLIRQALMDGADNASDPNNTYGWGIMNLEEALGWGANFSGDLNFGEAPAMVTFTDQSTLETTTWVWSFGDGDSSFVQNPSHYYDEPGLFDVSLTIDTEWGPITRNEMAFIILLGDTVTFASDSAFAGQPVAMSVNIRNSQPLTRIQIPFTIGASGVIDMDSVTFGERTIDFDTVRIIASDPWSSKWVVELMADPDAPTPYLPAGSGEVMQIHFSTDPIALSGESDYVDSTNGSHQMSLTSPQINYEPQRFDPATISMIHVISGDLDYSLSINIGDLTHLVAYVFTGGAPPVCTEAGDCTGDMTINVADVTHLVTYLFQGGPPPGTP